MTRWKTILRLGAVLATGAVLTAACAMAARVRSSTAASPSQEQSILQDDNHLLYVHPDEQRRTLRRLKGLGVDVVKVSMIWALVAPDRNSTRKPNFDASDPAAYPTHIWDRYDSLVETAQQLGLRVYFQLAAIHPAWASAHNVPSGQSHEFAQAPNLRYFSQFVTAVGRRYGGNWTALDGTTIPRVSYWGIWNEPNVAGSLNPWHRTVNGMRQLTEPLLYRGIANTAWRSLSATGHGSDTILIGESADYGITPPIPFMEDLYCVGRSFHSLTGRAAQAVGCPSSPNRSAFVSQNPGLFHLTGWAHHPYGFDLPPNQPYPKQHYHDGSYGEEVTIANLGSMERALNGIFASYHHGRAGGIPLYLTEWGYVTNPPNPVYRATLQNQASWLNQGEYMTWGLPYVKALAQFELVDVKTRAHQTDSEWRLSFTSGLEFQNGSPKPGLAAYRLPIWLPTSQHGPSVPIWGQLKPADHSTTQVGSIQFKRRGSSTWKTLQEAQTTSSEGFLYTHVAIGSAGLVRLGWTGPTGQTYYSRSVSIS